MDHEHAVLATLDLGAGWRVGVCECGWASPNVRGEQQALMAVRRHAVLVRLGLGRAA